MIVLIWIGVFLFLLLSGFLIAPVRLYIDSSERRFEVTHWPVITFSMVSNSNEFSPALRIFGIRIRPRKRQDQKPKPDKKKGKRKRRFSRSLSAWISLITQVMKSFQVKNFTVDIDTDNVVLNAKLVPLFVLASGHNIQLTTNYSGRVYLHLEALNRFGKLAWIFIKFLIKK